VLDPDRMEECAVASVDQALADTQLAFDGVAATYGRSNDGNRTLCEMRLRTIAAVTRHVPAGSRILDLGCGPGCDDEQLARSGYRVTAIDWSPGMVDQTRRRAQAAGVADRVEVQRLGIQELERLAPATFDAALSNFGPLNCVPSLPDAARLIADRLRPRGMLVVSVIGRVCPWEIARYLIRGDWPRAGIRFSRDLVGVPLEGRTVWMRYHTPGTFERAFKAAGFARVSVRALGLFVPPPYMQAFADRHRKLVARLQRVDDLVGACPGLRGFGDHFLMVLRKA
jgi:SAM-dependent methyltransferase